MKLLNLEEAAKILSVSKGIAKKLLESIPCVDYGMGRGKGKRWLQEDVENLISKMCHKETTSKLKKGHLAGLSAGDIYALTQGKVVQ